MREYKDLKITVVGTGYVGLSIATLLAQRHHVMAVDIVPEKHKTNYRCSLLRPTNRVSLQ